MNDFTVLTTSYSVFRKNKKYPVYNRGSDWVLLKRNGKLYYVPDSLEYDNPRQALKKIKKTKNNFEEETLFFWEEEYE